MTMIKTKKTELNDEFVLLRKFVRQARVHVINKLTRKAKELRASDEKRRRTNVKRNEGGKDDERARKSKAERLLREVFALKRIKDDEISKFGIVNFEKLQSMLHSTSSDDGTRAMAKIVLHKSLNPKIAALQDKFPECKQYMSEKEAVTERTNGTTDSSKRLPERTTVGDDLEKVQKPTVKNVEKVQKQTVKNVEKVTVTNDDDVREPPKKKKRKTNEAAADRETEDVRHSAKRSKAPETGTESTKSEPGTVAKVISREATVKRLAEVLREPESRVDEPEIPKDQSRFRTEEKDRRVESVDQLSNETEEADDFFLNSNKTVPRSVPEERRMDDVHDVDYDKPYPTSKRKKFHDGKESYNQKWNNKERSKGVVRHDRTDTHEANGARRGNRKAATPNEKRESDKSMNMENERDLHPSWAAKKKQQDILKQGFQGKKIKFDED